MSTVVDERIVEMRFDHKQFKSGAQETLSMLDRLKQALDLPGAAKGFEQIDKAAKGVSLDGIAASVDALANRFSTLGIVGMRVISNITDSIMGKLSQAIGFVQSSIVSGGIRRATNIENAHFQLQALLKDEEKVQAIMDDAMKSVDGTAYAYDEAARAASQFAASGVQQGEQMLQSLRGIVGVAAMTNSEFEGIANIFTTVAGNGRLMGDQLLQLSGRGLNAAATIAEFVNGVNDGTKETTDNIKAAVREISGGMKVTEGDIREFVSKGKISFDIFSGAMTEAFADSAERANETFTGAFSNMKSALARIGAGFISPLVEQNSEVIGLFNALRVRINDVKKALVFDSEIGNVNALSKQFTDSVLKISKSASEFLNNLDLTEAMELFYYGLEIVKNSAKGLFSVIKPIGNAFQEVFSTVSTRNIIDLASKIESFTSKLKLSERGSEGLQKAFKGLFSVGKLLIDIFIKLLAYIVPVTEPVGSLADVILTLVGAIGDALTAFTAWIRSSERIRRAYDVIGDVIRNIMVDLTQFINKFFKLYQAISDTGVVQKAIRRIRDAFEDLYNLVEPYLMKLPDQFEKIQKKIKELLPKDIDLSVESFTKGLKKLIDVFKSIDFTKPSEAFDKVTAAIQKLIGGETGGLNIKGFSSFVDGMRKYAKDLMSNFDLSKLTDNVGDTEGTLSKFTSFIKDKFLSVFGEGFNLSSITSTATGIGVIYSMIEGIKALNKLTSTISGVNPLPDLMKSVKKTLEAYQKDLNASALLKTAGAIAILAAALTVLSFVDPERLMSAATGLSLAAGVLLFGSAKLIEALKKTKTIEDIGFQLTKVLKGFTKAIQIKAIGSAIKDFAIAVAIIAVTLIGLGIMYNKDKDSLEAGAKLVGEIAIILVAVMAGMTVISGIFKSGSKNFMKSAIGIALIAAALGTVVNALKTLFKMNFPTDWQQRVGLLGGLLLSVAGLVTVLGISSRLAKGGTVKAQSITSLAAGLYIVVIAMEKLFKMDLPNDYPEKLLILGAIMAGIAGLTVAMGLAGKLSGGAIKAGSTILAMCVFVGVIVAALSVLSLIEGDKLIKSATALGIVLMSLAVSLAGAAKIANVAAAKTITSMAVTIAAITASLASLTLFSFADLFKSAVILGSMLLVLASDFNAVSKITNEKVWITVLGMTAMIGTIAVSLVALSNQPWENVLAAGVSMGLVMISIGNTMKSVSNTTGISVDQIAVFALCIAGLLPISMMLKDLAEQPWQNLLAAGTAMAEVLTSMAITMRLCTSAGNMAQAALVGMGLLDLFIANFALVLMAIGALWRLDGFKKLITDGGEALSAIGGAIGGFIGGILSGALQGISSALPKIGEDLASFIENLSPFIEQSRDIDSDVLKGVGYLAASIVAITAAEVIAGIGYFLGGNVGLLNLADMMSTFMEKLEPFVKAVEQLDEGTVEACLYLSEMIIVLTAAEILQGVKSWFGSSSGSLSEFGEELAAFGPYIVQFAEDVKDVKPDAVKGAAAAAEIMAEVATKLPGMGGLWQKLSGTKSLAEFGKELAEFGPYISEFSEVVKDVKKEAVEGAASAADIMATLADNLPPQGGLAQKIFGTKSLAEFGEELNTFGPYIKEFAKQVKNVKPEAVEGVKATTDILTTMADNLPNSETLWQKIFGGGKMSLSDFGEEIKKYGEIMSELAGKIGYTDVKTIEDSIEAFKHLIDLADLTSGKSADGLVQFSKELGGVAFDVVEEFSNAFIGSKSTIREAVDIMISYAYDAIKDHIGVIEPGIKSVGITVSDSLSSGIASGKDTLRATINMVANNINDEFSTSFDQKTFREYGKNAMESLISSINAKKDVVRTTTKTVAEGVLSTFKTSMSPSSFTKIGQEAIQALISAINGKRASAVSTSRTVANDILTTVKTILTTNAFIVTGQNIFQGLINGMNAKQASAISSAKTISNGVLSAINGVFTPAQFQSKGASIIQALQTGMQSQSARTISAANNMANNIVSAFKSVITIDQFKIIGSYAATGLAQGIESKISEIRDAAIAAARAAIEAAKKELDEHSPSKVFHEMGEFASEGLANGILELLSMISNAAQKASERAEDPVKNVVEGISDSLGKADVHGNPTIHPVVDLSDVRKAANETKELFKHTVDLSAANQLVNDVASSFAQNKANSERESISKSTAREVTINMEQNNYSPKSLSRTDIYRQTNNLFTNLKNEVMSR